MTPFPHLSGAQILAAVCLGLASLGFLIRSRLLCREAPGWPHAPLPVRAALFAAFLAMLGRLLTLLLQDAAIEPSEAAVYVVVAAYSTTMAGHLLLQRAGWPLDWRPRGHGGVSAHNGHGHGVGLYDNHPQSGRDLGREPRSWLGF